MRKLIFSINISLDGFADHTVAIADDELHDFSTDQLNDLDTVLFGRVTYQLFESYWPTAPGDPNATRSMVRFAHKINALPKIVFSKTLQSAGWNNTKLVKGNAMEEIRKLKQGSGKNMSVGGITLAQSLMKEALIDEYWLLVHPIIVGAGRRLFAGENDQRDLKLVDTQTFHSGVVVLHYLQEGNRLMKRGITMNGDSKHPQDDDLPRLAAPAQRALASVGVQRLDQLTGFSEDEIQALHGIGPNALDQIHRALRDNNLSFASRKINIGD